MSACDFEECLRDDLRRLGVRPGDLLMVHASLRKIGLARADVGEGGAEAASGRARCRGRPGRHPADGAGHRLSAWTGSTAGRWPSGRPCSPAPSRSIRRRAGAARGRLAGRGVPPPARHARQRPIRAAASARAAPAPRRCCADQPWHDYYGPGSPLQKLCDCGGRILRLGADPETVTALHYAEYLADLPDKRRTRWDYVLHGDERARAMSGSTASTTAKASCPGTARIISP